MIEASPSQWASLPAESQMAVMDAHRKRGAEALPTVCAATESPHPAVRVAAWQALAELNAPATIPALAKAAAGGEPDERAAARDTLARMTGAAVGEALLDELNKAEPPAKAELLRVLGDRGEAGAVNVLLKYADADAEPLRLAALDSLRKLAVDDSIVPLLELIGKSHDDADLEPVRECPLRRLSGQPQQGRCSPASRRSHGPRACRPTAPVGDVIERPGHARRFGSRADGGPGQGLRTGQGRRAGVGGSGRTRRLRRTCWNWPAATSIRLCTRWPCVEPSKWPRRSRTWTSVSRCSSGP